MYVRTTTGSVGVAGPVGVLRAVGVVDRVEEAVVALETERRQPPQVARALRAEPAWPRGRWRTARRPARRRGPRFSPRPGHAERLVLIGAVPIDGVVGGLGDAPGDAALRAVVDLAPDRHPARLIQQRPGIAARQQQRHQVLEQRRGPRQQHRRAVHGGHGAPEMEPVRFGHVALADREKARQPRFGGQQVVARDDRGGPRPRRRPAGSRRRTAAGARRRAAGSPSRRTARRRARRDRAAASPSGRRRRQRRAAAGRGERHERASEIAAVDGGHISRRERRRASSCRTS